MTVAWRDLCRIFCRGRGTGALTGSNVSKHILFLIKFVLFSSSKCIDEKKGLSLEKVMLYMTTSQNFKRNSSVLTTKFYSIAH